MKNKKNKKQLNIMWRSKIFQIKPLIVELENEKPKTYWINFRSKKQMKKHLRTFLYCTDFFAGMNLTYFDRKRRIIGKLLERPRKLSDETWVIYLQEV